MLFRKTMPASSSEAKSSCSARSFVQALAPNPNALSFASSIASAASLTRNTEATGPKISSLKAGALRGTSVKTVGS